MLLKFSDFHVCLSQEVIRRLGGQVALKLCADLIRPSEDGILSRLLSGKLRRRDRSLLCFFEDLFFLFFFFFLSFDFLFQSGN